MRVKDRVLHVNDDSGARYMILCVRVHVYSDSIYMTNKRG
jgi:hypothetical protein